jgi:diguanylate cyclase (GGDEF)-like protein
LQNALLHQELERLSVTDRLTELYNHGYFKQRLDEEFQRSVRFGHPLSLIMLDIDDFKEFNDSFGHPCGDRVLKSVSEVIRKNLRDMDIAARYGGEEFVVVLPETTCDGATMVAERIRVEVERVSHEIADMVHVNRTVSIGVATYPGSASTAQALLEAADSAMYRGKRAGKNTVVAAGSCV